MPVSNFACAGKGMPVLRARHYGDLYVQIDIETPSGFDPRPAKNCLMLLPIVLDGGNYPEISSFGERSKNS